MNTTDISKSLSKLGLKRTDTVMIHGDAIVSTQLNLKKFEKDILNLYLDILIDYFYPNGTIVIPTYTYNMTNNKVFDKYKSPSKIGLFSESFRMKQNVIRSNHPIFSVSSIGKFSKKLTNYNLEDCFGKNSFFDIFTKLDGKIVCMGCPLERITYLHYVEQKFKVDYRYLKKFSCAYREKNQIKKIKISYYVRDLNKSASLDFKFFSKKIKNIIKNSKFGRFNFSSIESKALLKKSKLLIKKYPHILVGNKSEI